jgi:hypothetical protein
VEFRIAAEFWFALARKAVTAVILGCLQDRHKGEFGAGIVGSQTEWNAR